MEAVRFAREGGSKALGCLVYLAVVLAAGLFVGLMGLAFGALGLKEAGLSENAAMIAGGVLGLALFAGVAWFGWRDFRRRAFLELLVSPRGLVFVNGRERVEFPFDEIDVLRLREDSWARTAEIVARDGRRRRLPADIAPFEQVEPLLEVWLLPGLLKRFETDLAAGRSVTVREGGARAVGRVFYGIFLLLLAPLMIVSIRLALKGLEAFRLGIAKIRQGWRGRTGGFVVTAEGVRPPGEEARVLPWRDLTVERLDAHGVVLASLEGPRVSASRYADNVWAASRLIAGRLK